MQAATASMIYDYQKHMIEARGLDAKTIDARLRHVHQFIASLADKELTALKPDDIIRFKKTFIETDQHSVDARSLAASTIVQTCHNLKAFIDWLCQQPGYRRLPADIADYCAPPRREVALAHTPKPKYVPSPEELRKVLSVMPSGSFKERRDRAVLAFLFLTGVRDGALISLRMKHVDQEARTVFQDAIEVKTKFSKTMHTAWFPVGEEIEAIVVAWMEERQKGGASEDAPLFPSGRCLRHGTRVVESDQFWATAAPVRKIIRLATKLAGVPYFRPHAIRSTLAKMSYDFARTPEEQKALSQNLGHEDIATTLQHYGTILETRQHELIKAMWSRSPNDANKRLIERISRMTPEKVESLEGMLNTFSVE